MTDAKLIIGVLIVAGFMFIVTVVGTVVGNKDESDKKVTYKKENSWVWQAEKK